MSQRRISLTDSKVRLTTRHVSIVYSGCEKGKGYYLRCLNFAILETAYFAITLILRFDKQKTSFMFLTTMCWSERGLIAV